MGMETGKHVGMGVCGKYICSIASNKGIDSGHTLAHIDSHAHGERIDSVTCGERVRSSENREQKT